jgi:hypothetical protein
VPVDAEIDDGPGDLAGDEKPRRADLLPDASRFGAPREN